MNFLKINFLYCFCFICCINIYAQKTTSMYQDFDTDYIVLEAQKHVEDSPLTITSFHAERSLGGQHDYYSEGPYWWADSTDLDGPYIRRDGLRNPNNFQAHRKAIGLFRDRVITLTAAYLITNDESFAQQALADMKAWFVHEETRMNPAFLYAQAIKGIVDGRGIGLIDAIGLIDIANSFRILTEKGLIDIEDQTAIRLWYHQFAEWMTTHPYGIDEQQNNNNHSTWWGAQVAAYGLVCELDKFHQIAVDQFENQLSIQLADDGSFPEELARTKPFGYSNYNLSAWVYFAILTSTEELNMFEFRNANGNLIEALDYIFQYYENPKEWEYETSLEKQIKLKSQDYMFLAGKLIPNEKYLAMWQSLNPEEGSRDGKLILWQYLYQL